MTDAIKLAIDALKQSMRYAQNDHPAGSDVYDSCDNALAALRAQPLELTEHERRYAETVTEMFRNRETAEAMKVIRAQPAKPELWQYGESDMVSPYDMSNNLEWNPLYRHPPPGQQQTDHSELVKLLRSRKVLNVGFGSPLDQAADALEGKL